MNPVRNQWLLILAAAVALLLVATGCLSYFLLEEMETNKAHQAQVNILQADMVRIREESLAKIDTLQKKINLQVDFNNQVKEDLAELDRTKADINSKADEEKTDIGRIRDTDSLRNAVTRHYRR